VSQHRMGVLVATALAVALCALGATARQAAGRTTAVPNAALQWDDIAASTVAKSGSFQNEGFLYMGYVTSAVFRAASKASDEDDGVSVDAALIEAAYRTLLNYFPAPRKPGSPDLDALYAQSLAAIPDGEAKLEGQRIGARAASKLIASRADDGRMSLASTSTFPTLAPGPGVWRLTPPAYLAPQTPWLGNVRPFNLRRGDQFQPAPPPSLSSSTWVNAFNEVKADGTGTDPVKRATALFWTANVILQYNQVLRDIAGSHNFDTLQTARAMAMVNTIAADQGIACMNAKYHFAFWRPVTAIDPTSAQASDGFGSAGVDDGNPLTVEQVGWRPLIATPNHPEYPSAHGSLTGAMSAVFAAILGTSDISLTVHGFDATGPAGNLNATRTFATAQDLRTEIGNARIWGGLHYRFSTDAGLQLGQQVARYDLRRFGDDEDGGGGHGGGGGHDGHDGD
jgi:vanadium-dependent haloperoxidase-like protein